MKQAYIALGSNLNQPLMQLRKALDLIGIIPDLQIVRCSLAYRNPSYYESEQPDFYNAVVKILTQQSPHCLMQYLLSIEIEMGKKRKKKNEARIIDLDLIWYEGANIATPLLTVPHPFWKERPFVVIPLKKIADLEWLNQQKVSNLFQEFNFSSYTF